MTSELFGHVQEFPDDDAGDRFDSLVGLDDVKARLIAEATVLLEPAALMDWSHRNYGTEVEAIKSVGDRVPLIVLTGDVGTGKTELAETVGHPIARSMKVAVTLYPLSLTTRGTGLVGQMTTLITSALAEVRSQAENARTSEGRLNRALILLVDEADSVAQSRELSQMHHEDRAGVNALIQGVDGFRKDHLPVLTILCTNRGDSIDPAVARRAAHIFTLGRPTLAQRRQVLSNALDGMGISPGVVDEVATLLGETDRRPFGATYSDLRQRFIPDAVLSSFAADSPVTEASLTELARVFAPTRPFASSDEA